MQKYCIVLIFIIFLLVVLIILKQPARSLATERFIADFEVKPLYQNPDITLIKGFLTPEECDHIIKIGEPHIKKSEVCGRGGSKPHKSRTSMTAHIGKKFLRNDNPDKILERILEKTSI